MENWDFNQDRKSERRRKRRGEGEEEEEKGGKLCFIYKKKNWAANCGGRHMGEYHLPLRYAVSTNWTKTF